MPTLSPALVSPRSSVAGRQTTDAGSPSLPTPSTVSPDKTALRWLETSATRPKLYHAPERLGAGHYHHAHHEILTPDHAQRQYTLIMQDLSKKDPEWLDDLPLFGAPAASFHDHPLTREQEAASRRVLNVLGNTLEIDYCPLLLDLVPLLMVIMETCESSSVPAGSAAALRAEAVVYAVVRNMHLHRPFYFGTGHHQFLATLAAFRDYMRRYFPETAACMAAVGADTEDWLGVIFYRCLVPLVAHRDLLRLLELFLEDGVCFFFRFTLCLFKEMKWRLKSMELERAALWWDQLADITFSIDFDIDQGLGTVLAQYGTMVKRSNLDRLLALRMSDPIERELIVKQDIQPLRMHGLGLVADVNGSTSILHNKRTYLKLLASFLPLHQRQRKLSMLFSSDRHGRSLDSLYRMCGNKHPCILIIEEYKHGHVIGAYCPDPINPGNAVSGTGVAFLFRLTRPAVRYSWARDATQTVESDMFQLATKKFFAVGMSNDTDHPGLKVDADLETGSSHYSRTFANLPLCGRGQEKFGIRHVEVHTIVTQPNETD
ncbi:hypothetical protein VYU27_004116 [Nannochloropsis oceanica]